ncbi:MAG: hypothetical protein RJA61_593 [Candidatus Parcubacteria bacterium]|jgi:glyoxylate reductase
MKKILVTERIPGPALDMLTKEGFEVHVGSESGPLSKEGLIKKITAMPYDAVLSLLTNKIDSTIFDVAPTVKIYANYAVGFDNIDIVEAKKRGITVTNTPTPLVSEAVAEHTLALLFSLMMRVTEGDSYVRRGLYKAWDPNLLIHPDMQGKVVGIVGAGHIGATVGRVMHHGFGCTVVYQDIKRNQYIEEDCNASYKESLEDLLKVSDIVTLHVPLMPQTKHLINAKTLGMMKDGAYLINTARGGVVDERALAEVLSGGRLGGVALDVFEDEPQVYKGLLSFSNVLLTPHVASATVRVRDEMSRIAASNIIAVLKGEKAPNAL